MRFLARVSADDGFQARPAGLRCRGRVLLDGLSDLVRQLVERGKVVVGQIDLRQTRFVEDLDGRTVLDRASEVVDVDAVTEH
ncbi:hypothetical protein AAG742_00565 [Micrococcus sp. 2A]